MVEKSAVIIGGGLGGLFTGAILAKEGLRVTVIDKNAAVGGGLQSFSRFGQVFDTGMHVIGGMQKGGNIRRICEYLGIWDDVHVRDCDPECIDSLYYAEDRKFYRIAQGRERFVDTLAGEFPDQRENLKAYVDALYRVVDELDLFFLRPSGSSLVMHSEEFMMAADQFVAKYITDRRLRSIVAYMNPLYAGMPGQTPTYIHALISVLYINGSSRFEGGSQLFADTLVRCIRANGGTVIAGDGVVRVSTADKLICGVTTRSGRSFSAGWYICAIHPCTFIKLLDDPSVLPKAYRSRLESIPNAYSVFTVNIKLKPGTFRYINHSCFHMGRYEDCWGCGDPGKTWPNGFLCMTPPEIGQGEFAEKMILTSPMTWDKVKKWEDTYVGHRGEEYEKWKEECAEKLICGMEDIYPGFRDCIDRVNTASPLTIRDFYGVKEGSMCGFSKDCNNMALSQVPVVTKVRNLLLTGQNCNVHGFCGVPLTAINTAEAILGLNTVLGKLDAAAR